MTQTIDTRASARGLAPGHPHRLEHRLAVVLTAGTVAGIALLAVGVTAMAASGIRPLGGNAPGLDLGRLPGDLLALRPAAFLWLGLVAIVVTPSARVAASLVGFAREGNRRMAAVAVAVLVVIGLSIVAGRLGA